MFKLLAISIFSVILTVECSRAKADEVDVLPSLNSPRLQFGTGNGSAKGIEVFSELPSVPGAPSSWTLVQWRKAFPLKPNDFTRVPGSAPQFVWKSQDDNSELIVSKVGNQFTFNMIGGNGFSNATGESDLGLSADIIPHAITAEHELSFSVNARISRADVTYSGPEAKKSGVVLAQGGIAFRASFHDPETNKIYSVQLGIPLINSRNPRPEHIGCHFFGQVRTPQLNSQKLLRGSDLLPFRTDGEMRHLNYRVNDYICDFISRPVPCRSDDGPHVTVEWPASAANLSNWKIASLLISIGTQNRAALQKDTSEQGAIKVGLEISDPRLIQSSALFNGGFCPSKKY